MKTNPFPWFPWWPKIEESHVLPLIVVGIILGAVLIYLASQPARQRKAHQCVVEGEASRAVAGLLSRFLEKALGLLRSAPTLAVDRPGPREQNRIIAARPS
jgi:hypothetical protein